MMMRLSKVMFGLAAIGLVSFSMAHAGGWDIGAFDNDDALDYIYELQEYDTDTVLWMPLGESCVRADYIDAMTGAQAIASAEIIAAVLGEPGANLPAEVQEIVTSYVGKPDAKLIGAAKACVERVLDTDVSELAQLWQEVGDYAEWQEGTQGLIERLQRD